MTAITPPKRLPKTADYGDCRYYEWECPVCGGEWQGSYDRTIIDTGGCEPYTLRFDGADVGSYSYETAADMHSDFRSECQAHMQADIASKLLTAM